MKRLTCSYADLCLPCYWAGHHLPYISVPVNAFTTPDQLRADLIDELEMHAVMGEGPRENDEAWHQAAVEAVRSMEITSDLPFAGLGDIQDAQAYFVFEEDYG